MYEKFFTYKLLKSSNIIYEILYDYFQIFFWISRIIEFTTLNIVTIKIFTF